MELCWAPVLCGAPLGGLFGRHRLQDHGRSIANQRGVPPGMSFRLAPLPGDWGLGPPLAVLDREKDLRVRDYPSLAWYLGLTLVRDTEDRWRLRRAEGNFLDPTWAGLGVWWTGPGIAWQFGATELPDPHLVLCCPAGYRVISKEGELRPSGDRPSSLDDVRFAYLYSAPTGGVVLGITTEPNRDLVVALEDPPQTSSVRTDAVGSFLLAGTSSQGTGVRDRRFSIRDARGRFEAEGTLE